MPGADQRIRPPSGKGRRHQAAGWSGLCKNLGSFFPAQQRGRVLGYAGFFGINLILPQWLQTQMGYTATWAGLAVAPIGILPVLMSPFVGKYANKFDLRLLAGLAFLAIGLSCFMRADFTNQVDFQHVALVQLFMGIGVALFFCRP